MTGLRWYSGHRSPRTLSFPIYTKPCRFLRIAHCFLLLAYLSKGTSFDKNITLCELLPVIKLEVYLHVIGVSLYSKL